jgi:hypothetical protein
MRNYCQPVPVVNRRGQIKPHKRITACGFIMIWLLCACAGTSVSSSLTPITQVLETFTPSSSPVPVEEVVAKTEVSTALVATEISSPMPSTTPELSPSASPPSPVVTATALSPTQETPVVPPEENIDSDQANAHIGSLLQQAEILEALLSPGVIDSADPEQLQVRVDRTLGLLSVAVEDAMLIEIPTQLHEVRAKYNEAIGTIEEAINLAKKGFSVPGGESMLLGQAYDKIGSAIQILRGLQSALPTTASDTPGGGTAHIPEEPSANSINLPATQGFTILVATEGQVVGVDAAGAGIQQLGSVSVKAAVVSSGGELYWVQVDGPPPDDPFTGQSFQILELRRDEHQPNVLVESSTLTHESYDAPPHVPSQLVLSSDGRTLLFDVCRNPYAEGFCEYYALDLSSRQFSKLDVSNVADAGWISPDGSKVILLDRNPNWTSDINAQGDNPKYVYFIRQVGTDTAGIILSDYLSHVVWLADGRFIYSVAADEYQNIQGRLILARSDGSIERVLLDNFQGTEFILAPDQQQVAYISKEQHELRTVNLADGSQDILTTLPDDAKLLLWRQ